MNKKTVAIITGLTVGFILGLIVFIGSKTEEAREYLGASDSKRRRKPYQRVLRDEERRPVGSAAPIPSNPQPPGRPDSD